MRKQVMELSFDDVTMDGAVAAAMTALRAGDRCRVVTPNAEFGLLARTDGRFRAVLNESQLVLPDGVGVLYAARILGAPIAQRVGGCDFAQALCAAMAAEGRRLFLLGAKPGVAEAAGERLRQTYPGLVVAGTRDGYFKEDAEAVAAIRAAAPDAVFVCLGAPKQEFFMADHGGEIDAPVLVGLGGTLDVLAGTVKRAPAFFQKAGLEWFYRLCKEPRRIGRMARLPLYLWYAFCWKLKGGSAHAAR